MTRLEMSSPSIWFQSYSINNSRSVGLPQFAGGVDKTWAQAHGLAHGPPYGLPPENVKKKIIKIKQKIIKIIIIIK